MTKSNKNRHKNTAHRYQPPLDPNYKRPYSWKHKKALGEQTPRLKDNWEKVKI